MVKARVSPHVGAKEAATEVAEELGQDVPKGERPQRARKNPPQPKPVPGRRPGRPSSFGFKVSAATLARREEQIVECRCTHCGFGSGNLTLREARATFNAHACPARSAVA